MQVIRFQSGGYVIHRIAIGYLLFSAWYREDGTLIDCEQSGGRGIRSSAIRKQLQTIGRRYVLQLAKD